MSQLGEIKKGINRIACRGRLFHANYTRNPQGPPPSVTKRAPPVVPTTFYTTPIDFRSFVEVDSRRVTPKEGVPVLELSCILEIKYFSSNVVLAEDAKSLDMLCNFPLDLKGYDVSEIKYHGGMYVAVKFKSGRVAEVFKANKST